VSCNGDGYERLQNRTPPQQAAYSGAAICEPSHPDIRRFEMKSLLTAIAATATLAAAVLAAPAVALADDDRHDRRGYGYRGDYGYGKHYYKEHKHYRGPRYYVPAPQVYYPPPVVYGRPVYVAPPPPPVVVYPRPVPVYPQPGVTIGFGFTF
jgi:hypothetical protein